MKVFPLFKATPIGQPRPNRKNILDLSSMEKKGLDLFMDANGVSPKSWLLDGWLSCRVKRISPLKPALFIAEWAQMRKGHHPLDVLVALAKIQPDNPEPTYQPMPIDKETIKDMLKDCRGLSLDNDKDFETLVNTLADELLAGVLF